MSRHFLFTAALLPIIALPRSRKPRRHNNPPPLQRRQAGTLSTTRPKPAASISALGAQQFSRRMDARRAGKRRRLHFTLRTRRHHAFGKTRWQTTVLAQRKEKPIVGEWVVQRRGRTWRIIAGKRIWFESENGDFEDGKIAWRGKPKSVSNIRVQPVEDIAFDDDFMRVKEDVRLCAGRQRPAPRHSHRRCERWRRHLAGAKRQVGNYRSQRKRRSSSRAKRWNAFAFKTAAPGVNLAFTGRPFWNDYSIQAAARPEGATAIGIVAYAQDNDNYLLLHWSRRTDVLDAIRAKSSACHRARTDARFWRVRPRRFEDLQWYNCASASKAA